MLFNILRLLLIAAGIVFAIEWWFHPDQHYEILLGISVAVLALVEFLRGLREKKKKTEREQKKEQAVAEIRTKVDAALEAFRSVQSKAQQEPPKPATPQARPENPEAKRFGNIIELQERIEQLTQDLAKETKTDFSGTPQEVLSRLTMPEAFRNGIKLYLDSTDDLLHQPDAMLDWAVENGNTYIGVLELMIKNVKKPEPEPEQQAVEG